jgi:hypothetical protein
MLSSIAAPALRLLRENRGKGEAVVTVEARMALKKLIQLKCGGGQEQTGSGAEIRRFGVAFLPVGGGDLTGTPGFSAP